MIEIKNLTKSFHVGSTCVEALKNVTLSISDGDIFGIIGMSGAGKSTLVRCMNMLERPTDGQVIIDGCNIGELSDKELREKRKSITMIFQGFNLLMQKTCLKNICFPLELSGVKPAQARARAMELLEIVGLPDKANAYPAMLSGGQQQRIAIARALATDPKVLLCDEATSALDPNTTSSILELIRDINEKLHITVVIITHQMSVVESICQHVAILENGQIVETGEVGEVFSHPKSQAARSLVYPEGANEALASVRPGEHVIRVVFNGADAACKPMIARLAADEGIMANIAYASTRAIGEKAYGSMLLSIQGDDALISRAIAYLAQEQGVIAEEVDVSV